jgi:hypothetical protein
MPVIGFLGAASPDGYAPFVGGFLRGLKGAGFIDGENVAIAYRSTLSMPIDSGRLRRQDFEWRESRGLARFTTDKIRIRHKPQDREKNGSRSTGKAAGPG